MTNISRDNRSRCSTKKKIYHEIIVKTYLKRILYTAVKLIKSVYYFYIDRNQLDPLKYVLQSRDIIIITYDP